MTTVAGSAGHEHGGRSRTASMARSTIQPWLTGDHCGALWDDGSVYHAIVQESYDDGTCLVLYVDYNDTAMIPSSALSQWDGEVGPDDAQLNDMVVEVEELQNQQFGEFDYVSNDGTHEMEETEASQLEAQMDAHVLFGADEPGEGASKEERRKWRRFRLVREIVMTEQSYVEGCEVLVDVYITPLALSCIKKGKDKHKILPNGKEDVKRIFSDFDLITVLNRQFLGDLQSRVLSWTEDPTSQVIGDLFLQFTPYFKMYSQYVNNHESATRLLDTMLNESKYKNFQKFIEEANAHPSAQFYTLFGLLISPIQRVPRYKLLLRELVNHTPDDHPDMASIQEALDLVSTVAKHINEAIRARQNRDTIRAVQKQFTSDPKFVRPSRRFIRQGALTKICRNNSHKKYEFFLFNDMVAYASASTVGQSYKLHRTIPIDSAFQVEDMEDLDDQSNKNVPKNRMYILNSQKSFVAYAADENAKLSWLEDFDECIEEQSKTIQALDSEKAGAPKAIPMKQHRGNVNACPHCNESFSLFNRKYNCKFCGRVTCKDCSNSRLVQRGLLTSSGEPDLTPQRICDECATQIRRVLDPDQEEVMDEDGMPLDDEEDTGDSDSTGSGAPPRPARPDRPASLKKLLLAHKKLTEWTSADVMDWLRAERFEEYVPLFKDKDLTGQSLIACTADTLQSTYGMTKEADRVRLVEAIGAVRKQQKIAPPKPPRSGVLNVNRGNYNRRSLKGSVLYIPRKLSNRANAAFDYVYKNLNNGVAPELNPGSRQTRFGTLTKPITVRGSSDSSSDERKVAPPRPAAPSRRAPKKPVTSNVADHFISIVPVKNAGDRLNDADGIVFYMKLRTTSGVIRTIPKLYSAFKEFDQQWRLFCPGIETVFDFPESFPRGKVSVEQITARRASLETYIRGISSVPDLAERLADFVGVSLSKWRPSEGFYSAHSDWKKKGAASSGSGAFGSYFSKNRGGGGPARVAPPRPTRMYKAKQAPPVPSREEERKSNGSGGGGGGGFMSRFFGNRNKESSSANSTSASSSRPSPSPVPRPAPATRRPVPSASSSSGPSSQGGMGVRERSNTAEDLGIDNGIVARLARNAALRDQEATKSALLSGVKKTPLTRKKQAPSVPQRRVPSPAAKGSSSTSTAPRAVPPRPATRPVPRPSSKSPSGTGTLKRTPPPRPATRPVPAPVRPAPAPVASSVSGSSFCRECGCKREGTSKFCVSCGTPF